MAGKGAPPLFDLIRTSEKPGPGPGSRPPQTPAPQAPPPAPPPAEESPAPKAAPAPEPKPESRAERRRHRAAVEEPPPAAEPQAERPSTDGEPAPGAEGPQIDFKKKFPVPVAALYIAVPLILVGGLIAYSWGFNAGGKNRDDELKPFLQPGEVIDPLVSSAGQSPPSPAPGASPPAERSGPATQQTSQQPTRRPAASPVTRDTREPGVNYLLIARADGERAIKAAMALTERGLPTIAVESGSGRSNNAWRLYSLLGISSEKFKEEWQLRADHKAKIVAACRDLDAEAGGPIDASTAYWEKYVP